YRGRRPLFYARDNRDGKESVVEVTPGSPSTTYYSHYSVNSAANVVACSGETITTPDDLFVSPLDKFTPRVAAALNPEWPRTGRRSMEEVQWKKDGMELHGYLLTPPGAAPGKPLPTIVYTPGGPSMVRTGFQFDEGLYPFLTYATRGYAVFVPNNRGRNGWG